MATVRLGRYEARNYIMAVPGAVAPVVYGGKQRAVLAYMNRTDMQARDLAPTDLLGAIERSHVFLPLGQIRFGPYDWALDSNAMYELPSLMNQIPVKSKKGQTVYLQAGAGIVWDSVPEREYEETMNKARGMLRALEMAETQL